MSTPRNATATCMICGTAITATFWVCRSCEAAYVLNRPFAEWPPWAKALKDEAEKERRHEAHWREVTVVSIDAANLEERFYGGPNTDPIPDVFLAG